MSVITKYNSVYVQSLKRKGYISTSKEGETETGFDYILIGKCHIHYANVYEDGSFHLYGSDLNGVDAYNTGRLHGCSEEEFMTFVSVFLDNYK